MKRSIDSMKDLAEYFNQSIKNRASDTVTISKTIADWITAISIFMQTTKGRDKICSLIQYLADLYEACIKFSNIQSVQDTYSDIFSRKIATRIRTSMKNGRKIFKFLKFFDSIRALNALINKEKPKLYKLTTGVMHSCNFFYYIMDHLIWGINIGVLNEIVSVKQKSRLKGWKDSFSLSKAILKLAKAFFDYKLIYNKEALLLKELASLADRDMIEGSIAQQSAISLIASRKKRRQKQINFIVTVLRILMLLRRLRIFGIQMIFSKILYASSGLVITVINILTTIDSAPVKLPTEPSRKMTRAASMNMNLNQLKKVKSELQKVLDNEDSENEND